MSLQGESTLSVSEKAQEASRIVDQLSNSFEQMTQGERTFVEQITDRLDRFGIETQISNKQLFWLRDLALKY